MTLMRAGIALVLLAAGIATFVNVSRQGWGWRDAVIVIPIFLGGALILSSILVAAWKYMP